MSKKGKPMDGDIAARPAYRTTLSDLFHNHLAVIERGLELRQPDARQIAFDAVNRRRGQITSLKDQVRLKEAYGAGTGLIERMVFGTEGDISIVYPGQQAISLQARIDLLQLEVDAIDKVIRRHSKRALPKEIATEFDRSMNLIETPGPTPEASVKARRHEGTLIRLRERSSITGAQFDAGVEIALVFEKITASLWVKVKSLDGAGGRPGKGGAFTGPHFTQEIAELHSTRYLPWCASLDEQDKRANEIRRNAGRPTLPRRLPLIIDIIINDSSVRQSAARIGIGFERAIDWLRLGLSNYADRM